MHHKIIDTSRGHFAYLEDGPQDGELVICLHGFPDHAPSWHALMPHLANEGYRVIAPWLRGYAPSVTEGAFDIDSLTADTVELASLARTTCRSTGRTRLGRGADVDGGCSPPRAFQKRRHPRGSSSSSILRAPLEKSISAGPQATWVFSNCINSQIGWWLGITFHSSISCGKDGRPTTNPPKTTCASWCHEAVHPRATQLLPAHVATTHPVYPALGEPQSARA